MQIRSALRPAVRPALHGIFGHTSFPSGAILHFDANTDPYTEQTGGPHTFNYSIGNPQFQLQSDGSSVDVGAKVAADFYGGERWVRSCGAVENKLTNSVFAGAVSGTPGTAPTGWIWAVSGGSLVATSGRLQISTAGGTRHMAQQAVSLLALTKYRIDLQFSGLAADCAVEFLIWATSLPSGSSIKYSINGGEETGTGTTLVPAGNGTVSVIVTIGATAGTGLFRVGLGCTGAIPVANAVTICCPQLTATAYPLPHVPTTAAGPVTQPASNATATGGMWFSLPDGSPLWEALTGGPLTLATRVRMGVGSGDVAANTALEGVSCSASGGTILRAQDISGSKYPATSNDGTTPALSPAITWSRNAVMRRFVQVNTAGTQFRVGYMIEGAHTTIQWGSWAAYDGSFGPSTLYRLMLNFNNATPKWFNKITVWPAQVSDADLLGAWA